VKGAAAVLVLLAAALVGCGGGGSSDAGDPVAPVTEAGQAACPAKGHQDTFASGLTPDRIPSLPSGYSFTFVKSDGCSPVRFDPC
jgi:hypothetical protein